MSSFPAFFLGESWGEVLNKNNDHYHKLQLAPNKTVMIQIIEPIILPAIWFTTFTIAITIHEYAHAWMSDRLGDPTARLQNRLSLNPIRHYDPIGTTVLLFTAFSGSPIVFGWAKPVPVDPYNLSNPKKDMLKVALAGPAINLIMAAGTALISYLFLPKGLLGFALTNQTHILSNMELSSIIVLFLLFTILINVILALFNLIPIHPLDGGKILSGLLPDDVSEEYDQVMWRYGTLILIFLIIPWGGVSPVWTLLGPIFTLIISLLI